MHDPGYPKIEPEVARYMEENGATLEEAANEMGLNWDEVFVE